MQVMPQRLRLAPVVMAVLATACASHKSPAVGPGAGDAGGAEPFQPDPPAVYVAKVKNLLVGLPPTDDEVAAVAADAGQLPALIQAWMALPQYTHKMARFFELAFQQTQVSTADFADQAGGQQISLNATTTPLLMQNLQESFARTVLQLVAAGKPLSDAMSTQTFMMTTALKELYAFLDVWQVDDNGKVTDRFKAANPSLQITIGAASGAIPIADTLNPASPSYMHWYDPDVATANPSVAGCQVDPMVYPVRALTLHWLLLGSLDNRKLPDGTTCPQVSGTAAAAQLSAADFSDWTMVTVRTPAAGEPTTSFYDLPSLRAATTLTLSVPRVGFFSTPAFFANWQTNTSNQMRVTMNQALIVALGTRRRRQRLDGDARAGARAGHDTRARAGLPGVPPDAGSAAVDLLGDVFVELPQPARRDVEEPAGPVRLSRRHPAGQLCGRPRGGARAAPAAAAGLGSKALHLRHVGSLRDRRPRIPAAGRGVSGLGTVVEHAGDGAVLVAAGHERGADERRPSARWRCRGAITCARR